MGEKSSLVGVADLAERLHHRPSARDFERPPITVRDQSKGFPAERRKAVAREVLGAVIGRIGPPTLYGGAATGPVVRWRSEEQTVLLDRGAQGMQLSVRHTAELESQEAAGFERGECADPAAYYGRLPYLWLLYRGSGSPPLTLPAVETAPDWHWLEESLTALLGAWWEQLPAQIGQDTAGFNIVPRSGQESALETVSVLCSEAEGVMLLVDDREVPGGTPDAVMEARGWRGRIMGWWQRDFYDLGAEGAGAAARMAVQELRLRGVPSPDGLGVGEVRCEDGGLLVLPGLAIGT
ncbi:hypothetical protein Sliba_61880 [Streptomyces nigrescens]|uniref:Uncharacterized protein n=1 Tax=Streptomyces nigrescens TaxID=1920 RepID=A0A640TUF0_STRNI|nr:hypothetical protein Sliba_61880 [Streptomyces libani subsp. libani]GGV98892.1 hypothetical protein GCM10010500_48630 [Streptomyces libani subsp. libani]